jgi:CubicO group peptidase (beta-lactamase class C family)
MTRNASAGSARPAQQRRMRGPFGWLLVLVCLLLPSLATARFPAPTLSDRLKLLMSSRCESLGVPGFAMTVVEHGKVIFQGGYGYADPAISQKATPTTAFRIPRLVPALMSLALLRLQDQRRLFAVNPVGFYIEDLPAPASATPVIDLLNQAARPGLTSVALATSKGAAHGRAAGDAAMRGSQDLLQQLIEQISGQSFRDYLREAFFEPLGMSKTGSPEELASAGIHVARAFTPAPRHGGWVQEVILEPRASKAAAPSGPSPVALASSVEELKLLAQALLDREFINASDYRAIWYDRPRSGQPLKNGWVWAWHATTAADFHGQRLVSTAGDDSSAGAAIWLLPDRDAYIITLANIDTPGIGDIGRSAARMVFGQLQNGSWTQSFEPRPIGVVSGAPTAS